MAKKEWDKRTLQWRRHSTYTIWSNMLARCTNPKHHGWKDYGGRGITVCERWLPTITQPRIVAFRNFMHDMGLRPSQYVTLDREDANGPYCPENCNWRMPRHQANNKRESFRIDDPQNPGVKIAPADLARRMGITYQALRLKLQRQGLWPIPNFQPSPLEEEEQTHVKSNSESTNPTSSTPTTSD